MEKETKRLDFLLALFLFILFSLSFASFYHLSRRVTPREEKRHTRGRFERPDLLVEALSVQVQDDGS